MDDRKVWFFGESNTRLWDPTVVGIKKGLLEQYYEEYTNSTAQRWTEFVAEYFKGEEVNKAKIGSGNFTILFSIYENLNLIKKNDIVIVSNALPYRIPFCNISARIIEDFNPHRESMDIEYTYTYGLSVQDKHTAVNFINTFVKEQTDIWEEFYNKKYKALFNVLNGFNIETYFWDYSHWYRQIQTGIKEFETIFEATNYKLKDKHFSENGNIEFAKYFLNNITKFRV